LYHIICLR